jgi:EAL domain-containing protein (putative c-di-GMP-specific phosphodiesterase class I)
VKTWIKNIEDKETLRVASELKVDYLQGKYLNELQEIQ